MRKMLLFTMAFSIAIGIGYAQMTFKPVTKIGLQEEKKIQQDEKSLKQDRSELRLQKEADLKKFTNGNGARFASVKKDGIINKVPSNISRDTWDLLYTYDYDSSAPWNVCCFLLGRQSLWITLESFC